MPHRSRTEPADVRHRILDAALRQFSRNGYHRATLDGIAASAGVSKGAVYWHFENKSALFLAVVRQEIARLVEHLAAAARGDGQPVAARLEAMITAALTYYVEHPAFCSLLRLSTLPAGLELARDVEAIARDMYRQGRKMIGALLDEGVRKGEMEAGRARAAAPALVGLLDGLMCQWIVDRKGVPLRELAPAVARAFLEGIVRRAG